MSDTPFDLEDWKEAVLHLGLIAAQEIERLKQENHELRARLDESRGTVQRMIPIVSYSEPLEEPEPAPDEPQKPRKRAPRVVRLVTKVCGDCMLEKQMGYFATVCDGCRSRAASERMAKRQADRKAEKDREKLGSDVSTPS